MLHYVLGITKAYCTRVGGGPFPSELDIEKEGLPGYQMSQKGREFGTVTGRKRRCGWLDVAALRRSIQINGVTGLCITKLDVLDGLSELKICTGYLLDGKVRRSAADGRRRRRGLRAGARNLPGWSGSTVGANTMEALPAAARAYLARIEELCGIPVDIVSTGPERRETIVRSSVAGILRCAHGYSSGAWTIR
jgi:adenylosuccinate synthase